jgi:beta-glucosidase-like glycosyl hydrolase
MDAIDTLYTTEEATILAIEAGADIILFAAEPGRAVSALSSLKYAVESGRISPERIEESYLRVKNLKEGIALP